MRSRAWSVEGDAPPSLADSSDKLVTDLSRDISDMIVISSSKALEIARPESVLLLTTVMRPDMIAHQSPGIENPVEDDFILPTLPAGSESVLKAMKSGASGSCSESESSDPDISRVRAHDHNHRDGHRTKSRSSSIEDPTRTVMIDSGNNEIMPPTEVITHISLPDMANPWIEKVRLLPVIKY